MNDLVSRQAAIDELDKAAWGKEWDKALAKTMLESLPSAQPEIIRCKDCKHRGADDFCTGRGYPNVLVPDDGFCDKGEKRIEEEGKVSYEHTN